MDGHLTRNQSAVLLGCTAGLLAINAIAGRAVIKNHDEITVRYIKMAAVGESLARITSYQARLLNKHIDIDSLDEFDRMVMEDMAEDLSQTLTEFHRLSGGGEETTAS